MTVKAYRGTVTLLPKNGNFLHPRILLHDLYTRSERYTLSGGKAGGRARGGKILWILVHFECNALFPTGFGYLLSVFLAFLSLPLSR